MTDWVENAPFRDGLETVIEGVRQQVWAKS
jgi:hypothetical protein